MILQEELPTDDVNFFLACPCTQISIDMTQVVERSGARYSWGHPRYH